MRQEEYHLQKHEEDWVKAWHGTKFEALYSIMCFGRLFESKQLDEGRRHVEGAPGVYLHKEETTKQAEYCARFVQLANGTPL